jgi:tetratricopeptide (TPR) repeat protein
VFLEVIRDAPRFKPAWANLLLAEWPWDEPTRNRMRQHIAAARKLDPTMPEATLAEISLLPAGSFAPAMMLIDRARDLSPQNPDVLFSRASWLAEVGRLLESVDDARRAAALDPLSPATRNGYIATLTDAGQFDAAREELQRAEQLWPGTDMILQAHYLFHFRAGDPKEALRIAKSGGYRLGHTLFLEARINPTEENFQRLKAWFDGRKAGGGGDISFITQAYGVLGRDDDVFREYMTWPDRQAVSESARTLFRPWVRGLRQQPRFMQVAKRVGVLDYWRLSGKWPDFCNEPGLPYDCKKEAAKLLS